jgi:hypothetical protein
VTWCTHRHHYQACLHYARDSFLSSLALLNHQYTFNGLRVARLLLQGSGWQVSHVCLLESQVLRLLTRHSHYVKSQCPLVLLKVGTSCIGNEVWFLFGKKAWMQGFSCVVLIAVLRMRSWFEDDVSWGSDELCQCWLWRHVRVNLMRFDDWFWWLVAVRNASFSWEAQAPLPSWGARASSLG